MIETGAGQRAALALADGQILRLDVASRVRLLGSSHLELERGAVYAEATGRGLAISTRWGVVRDIGTRFEVRIDERINGHYALRVQVREGRVVLEQPSGAHREAGPGEALTVTEDGAVERSEITVYGPGWDWILAAAPPFAVEGKTLREVLDWSCAENGWTLEIAPGVLDLDDPIVFRGSIADVGSIKALDSLLDSAGLAYRLEDGRLLVEPTP